MRNVIIFSDRPSSDIQYALRDNDDYDVRVKSINELKEAEKYNPSVIILDIPEEKVREISMVVKLPVPTLLYSDKMYEDLKLKIGRASCRERVLRLV